jgi:hypothetical protein
MQRRIHTLKLRHRTDVEFEALAALCPPRGVDKCLERRCLPRFEALADAPDRWRCRGKPASNPRSFAIASGAETKRPAMTP